MKEKGAKTFGIHSFLASNTVTHLYYPELARQLLNWLLKSRETLGISLDFINLSGGIGVNYRPDQEPNDIAVIGEGVRKVYEEVLTPAGLGQVKIFTELGRFMLAPHGALVTRVTHKKKKPIVPIWAWMPQQSTSCAQPCMGPTTILPI